MPRWAVLVPALLLAGCSSAAKKVRLDTGQGSPIVHVPRRDVEPVEVDEEAFKRALAEHARNVPLVSRPLEHARRLFEVPERSGWYRYGGRKQRLTLLESEEHPKLELSSAEAELRRDYLLWCERTWGPGDCLRLLVDSPVLDGDGKYALAMAIAQGAVLGAMKEELGRMVNPTAVAATLVGAMTMYAILLSLPEPVSKGVAALMTLGAMAYLGWDTVWRLIDGWLVLTKEVDRATTFGEIRGAGERFGEVMGVKATRAFVMLAMVAVGNTAAGMASKMPALPGAGQAAVVAEAQLGIRSSAGALAQVESVAISAENVTIALAPGAVAMIARQPPQQQGRTAQATGELTGQQHHVISKRIAGRLSRHPVLQGHYEERDPRFVTRARDKAAHNGYQRWHREVDEDVIKWLDDHPKATPQHFENYLREVYSRPEVIERFPNGF